MADRRNSETYRAVSAGRSPTTEPRGWFQAVTRVVAQAGSVAGAARELDVPRRTLRRWLTGEGTPSAARQAQVGGLARQLVRRTRLAPGREARLRNSRHVELVAVWRYDGTRRTIRFDLGNGVGPTDMAPGSVRRVVDGFLTGREAVNDSDMGGLFAPLADGMADDWYRIRFQLGPGHEQGFDVERVRFT